MPRLADWIAAARPKTLPAAIAPVAVGTVLAWALTRRETGQGHWSLGLFLCTLASCMAIQVATNYFNDGLDTLKGADTRRRLGPRRLAATGAAAARTMLRAGALVLAVAALLALPLIQERGWVMLVIGLPSLYFAYGYTGGPMPLAYRGLGELFVILFFGLIAVTGSAFVQSGEWYQAAVVAGFQIGCLSTVLIAINNLRDVEEDRQSGKRTLAVRWGVGFARVEIFLLIVGAHAVGFYWWTHHFPRAFTLPLILLPAGLWLAMQIFLRPPGRGHNRLLALAGLQLILFAVLLCIGWITSPP
ncbi:MAG: 1,4-dihydroxy-2-naphthoate octaprenyltransferase [Verrucomicrobiales bacterium]|nr:1,4-dihydroxy-2-naphthoate octaprenyltransferase [Verrucomicrobiales bacterium]